MPENREGPQAHWTAMSETGEMSVLTSKQTAENYRACGWAVTGPFVLDPLPARGAVSADERAELEELRRFKAWALRDEPEYVKANATLKHRVRELEAELATERRTPSEHSHR